MHSSHQHVAGDEFPVQASASSNITNNSFTADGRHCVTTTDLQNGKYWVEHKVTVSNMYQTSNAIGSRAGLD